MFMCERGDGKRGGIFAGRCRTKPLAAHDGICVWEAFFQTFLNIEGQELCRLRPVVSGGACCMRTICAKTTCIPFVYRGDGRGIPLDPELCLEEVACYNYMVGLGIGWNGWDGVDWIGLAWDTEIGRAHV